MPERRWDRILRELRKLVFGACCATGGLAGLWTGIWRAPELDVRGGLLDELWWTLEKMLPYFGAGLALGIGVGVLICRALPQPRARVDSESQRTAEVPAGASIASGSSSAPVT